MKENIIGMLEVGQTSRKNNIGYKKQWTLVDKEDGTPTTLDKNKRLKEGVRA